MARVDDWMREPGAWVLGHRAAVQRDDGRFRAACGCGYRSLPFDAESPACLLLALHLQTAVRQGSPVMSEGDGLAGVREPRRPLPPDGHLSAARDIA